MVDLSKFRRAVYLLPKDLYPPDGCMLGEFPEDALEPGEYESRPQRT